MGNQRSIWDRLQNIDSRIIQGLLLIALILPLFHPLGLPVKMLDATKNAYAQVADLANHPGAIVFFQWDAHPVNYAEQGMGAESLLYHVLREPVKIIFFSLMSEGLVYFNDAIERLAPPDKIYGRDFVYLGYRAGAVAAAAAIADDFHSVFSTDYQGTPLDAIPGAEWLADVKGAADGYMLIQLAFMYSGTWVLQQWILRYPNLIWVRTNQTNQYPRDLVWINSGHLKGLVVGIRGAAEYDQLLGRQTLVIAQLDSQSTASILTLILIALSNIGYYVVRLSKKTEIDRPVK